MLIAGLGNPGREYEATRHNIGFVAADRLAERFKCRIDRCRAQALVGTFSFKGDSHLLAKPQTYMNLSGDSISRLLTLEEMQARDLLAIVDDVTLPLGRVRLRSSGGSGGHNGLKSIIGHIGEGFWRLRIGVGPAAEPASLVNHVLDVIPEQEMNILRLVLDDLANAVIHILIGQGGKAMSIFNSRCYPPPEKTDSEKPK
jgi:PTH1 family peptidyl-tRNA hydrolase